MAVSIEHGFGLVTFGHPLFLYSSHPANSQHPQNEARGRINNNNNNNKRAEWPRLRQRQTERENDNVVRVTQAPTLAQSSSSAWQLELLALLPGVQVIVEKVQIQRRLNQSRDPHDPSRVVRLGDVSIDPVQDVERPGRERQRQREEEMASAMAHRERWRGQRSAARARAPAHRI